MLDIFEIDLGSIHDEFGMMSGWICDEIEINLGSIWDRVGIDLE